MSCSDNKQYIMKYCSLCLFIGGIFGICIGYYYSVGYELADFLRYLLNKISELLQSFAFILLVIIWIFRSSLKSLAENICDNWKPIMEAIVKKRIEEQTERPDQRVQAAKIDGLGDIKI